ncbi:hypothetical protein [Amycolatopsis circi]|uniref:hypothetical protein n=1 Tax=Amycolatopsis circi TaxID=871959 RepID=UPI000E26C44D|nr:hypothetical protein [Amycolatopsis circi]
MTTVAPVESQELKWSTRADLSPAVVNPAKATGLLVATPTARTVIPFGKQERESARELTRETLVQAGVSPGDRVVVSLNNDADLTGSRIAEAAAEVGDAAVSVGPRGRMRLLETLERVAANVLVATPSGAADLLARLHMEFLVDPLDLELRLLLLVGEITDDKTRRHLAAEFGATVVEVYLDPVTGVPVAHRAPSGELVAVQSGLLALAALDQDTLVTGPARGELIARHTWHPDLAGVALRTGYVAERSEGGALLAPQHTVGTALLARGQWLSVDEIGAALRKIDGISRWRLEISRPGTLDTATLTVSFNRESLIRNGMWKGRIEQVLTALTPVTIEVQVSEHVQEEPAAPAIADHRGHHLGIDRSHAAE